MKVVQRYRHTDGRTLELCEESEGSFSLCQIYPHKQTIEAELDREKADKKIEELGFTPEQSGFSPPCPDCHKSSHASLETGLYFCNDCSVAF